MEANDDAGNLMPRAALAFFASELAPTVDRVSLWERACSRWLLTMTRGT